MNLRTISIGIGATFLLLLGKASIAFGPEK